MLKKWNLDRLTVFCFLWGCQALVHQEFTATSKKMEGLWRFDGWFEVNDPTGWLLTAIALSVLMFPRILILFVSMISISTIKTWIYMPYVFNHILVEAVLNMAMLSAVAWVIYQRRNDLKLANWSSLGLPISDRESRDQIFDALAPILRWMLVTVYAFATIAKLNYDFLNPAVSCAVDLYNDLERWIPIPHAPWAQYTAIWGTIAIEGMLAVCLAFKRLWKIGLVTGLLFHLMLGFINYRTFSVLAFALYFLFITDNFMIMIEQLRDWLHQRFESLMAYSSQIKIVLIMGTFGIQILELLEVKDFQVSIFAYNRALIWLAWSVLFTGIAFMAMRLKTSARPLLNVTRPPAFMWILVFLVFFNGMTQYLGLKTQSSFTMYSNLRTEGAWHNHIFMPAWLKIADYQKDLIEIVSTDHEVFQGFQDHDQMITLFEFKRISSKLDEDFNIEYILNGKHKTLQVKDGLSSDPSITAGPPLLAAKMLRLRPVSKGICMECMH